MSTAYCAELPRHPVCLVSLCRRLNALVMFFNPGLDRLKRTQECLCHRRNFLIIPSSLCLITLKIYLYINFLFISLRTVICRRSVDSLEEQTSKMWNE